MITGARYLDCCDSDDDMIVPVVMKMMMKVMMAISIIVIELLKDC